MNNTSKEHLTVENVYSHFNRKNDPDKVILAMVAFPWYHSSWVFQCILNRKINGEFLRKHKVATHVKMIKDAGKPTKDSDQSEIIIFKGGKVIGEVQFNTDVSLFESKCYNEQIENIIYKQ